ncbi:ABC transporter ATP-binding protein/permease [Arthrobacter flavus]|uniref:ABC transporter ATP-binding protein/permease n=1 Tax=Arthrobacter flavus TaxID=95172 RepID=A0ABW4Q3L2_9MICC
MFVSQPILRLALTAKWYLGATILAGLGASAAAVGAAFSFAAAVAAILGSIQTGSGTADASGTAAMVAPLIWAGVFTLARTGLLWLRDQFGTLAAISVKSRVRSQLMNHLFTLGPGRPGAGGTQATVVDGVEHLQAYVGFYLPQLVVTAIVPAVLVGILATRDFSVALVVLLGVATVPLAQRLWNRMLGERAEEHWEAFSAYSARITDTLKGIDTLVALGAAKRQGKRLTADAEKLREATNANLRASLGVSVVTASAMSIGTAGATVLAAFHAADGSLNTADVLLVLFLSAECFRPLQELQNYWHEGFYGIAAAAGINRVLETKPTVSDSPDAFPLALSGPPALEVKAVGFTYPGAGRPALQDVSFTVPAGATLAVVGRSGAGKSTLIQLILRDVDPTTGAVLLNERNLRSLPLAQIRRAAARVAQDIVLLDGTIAENIRQANPEATDADFREAVAGARVTEFTDRIPGGLDSPVGEGGALLSGGQRQRVALARALISRTPLLVLDEATSALDAENEALITEALHLGGNSRRTTVVIAHRLSTVVSADLVAVLDDGRLVEFGAPGDLAGQGGHWAQMLHAQLADVSIAGLGTRS